MKYVFIILISIFSSCSSAQPITVPHVDISKYMGIWYEIASIPQRFSKDCYCTRAQYSLNHNGTVKVFNSCNRKGPEGELIDIIGKAKIVDNQTNSKLKVSFFWPFYGGYWIIGLDKDYKYAVISNKNADSLWILSRTNVLSISDYNDAIQIAIQNGIDINKIKITSQKNCYYP